MTQIETPNRSWWKNPHLILALALITGLGLRLARSRVESLNFDEMWQLKVSSGFPPGAKVVPADVILQSVPDVTSPGGGPWYALWSSSEEITHPPVSFLMLHFWREIFGASDLAARSLSIVCSLLTVILIYLAGRMTLGTGPALWAAILFAVAPVQVYEGQQVRGYALLQTLGVLTALSMLWLERSGRIGAAIALAISTMLLMLTHYFGLGVALAMGVYALIQLRGPRLWMALGAFAAAAILFCAIWLPVALGQGKAISDAGTGFLNEDSAHAKLSALARAATAPWRQVISDGVIVLKRNPRSPWPYIPALLFVVPLFFLRRRPGLLMWYLWLVCMIGMLLTLDLLHTTSHLRFTRYIALAGPGVFLLFTGLLAIGPCWLRCAGPTLVLVASLVMYRSTYFREEGDWDQIGQILDQHSHREEPLVFYRGNQPHWYNQGYLFAAGHYSHSFPRTALLLSTTASADLVARLPEQSAWLITSATTPKPEEILPGSVPIEQYDIGTLATCWKLRLPIRNGQ